MKRRTHAQGKGRDSGVTSHLGDDVRRRAGPIHRFLQKIVRPAWGARQATSLAGRALRDSGGPDHPLSGAATGTKRAVSDVIECPSCGVKIRIEIRSAAEDHGATRDALADHDVATPDPRPAGNSPGYRDNHDIEGKWQQLQEEGVGELEEYDALVLDDPFEEAAQEDRAPLPITDDDTDIASTPPDSDPSEDGDTDDASSGDGCGEDSATDPDGEGGDRDED